MKIKILAWLIATVIVALGCYGVMAFACWDPNVSNWPILARFLTALGPAYFAFRTFDQIVPDDE